jgi:protein-S-isoprenylcysteine O-methyltransferase Ste14
VSTGLYGLVRHPMYMGAMIMIAGIPLALDSWWGLRFSSPTCSASPSEFAMRRGCSPTNSTDIANTPRRSTIGWCPMSGDTGMSTDLRATAAGLIGLAAFGVLLFVPAGTLNYWQAWVFLIVFAISTWIPALYLLRKNPAALDRRMRAGPGAETRTVQKIVSAVAFASAAAVIVLSVLDHRFSWSQVPPVVSVVGDALVAIGLGVAMLAVIQNSYAAANITVEGNQHVVSTGLYRLVRHPMYVGNLIMMAGIPLALGSYWGLAVVIPGLLVLVIRVLDEEKLLAQELAGYREYTQKVRYRLVPYVW